MCVSKQQLDAEGFRLPVRIDGAGRSTGGGPLSRGHIYKIVSNPIYAGRLAAQMGAPLAAQPIEIVALEARHDRVH